MTGKDALAPAGAAAPRQRRPRRGNRGPSTTTAGGAGGAGGAGAAGPVAQWRTLGGARSDSARSRAARTARPWDGRLQPSITDAQRAEQVGRLLQSAFGQILSRLPPRVVKVADIARWLRLDRSICQRIVIGVRDATDGLGVLERFPGLRGLEQFIAAAVAHGCPAGASRAARRALDEYARLVCDAGGSQARLVEQIDALRSRGGRAVGGGLGAGPAVDFESFRQASYESAVGLTGLSSAARVDIVILAPDRVHGGAPGDGDRGRLPVTTVSATGMIGIEAASYAMPLTRRSRLAGMRPVPAPTGSGAPAPPSGVMPDLLLRSFTSDPPPRVTTRTDGEYLLQIFNTENGGNGTPPFDVVAALAFSWVWDSPSSPPSNYYSIGRVIGPPTRRLIFDVYLHRALPPAVSVSAHVLRPGMQGSLGDARPQSRWFDRLPMEHDLILMAGAPGDRPSEGYGRLRELTRHLLDAMGWSSEPFTGYRLEVPYPLFDMEYVIAAEF